MITDQAKNFTSKLIKQSLESLNTELKYSSIHHAQSNSVERANKDIKYNLIKFTQIEEDWTSQLPIVTFGLNIHYSYYINTSPFILYHGRTPTYSYINLNSINSKSKNVYSNKLIKQLHYGYQIAKKLNNRYLKTYQSQEPQDKPLQPGEIVLLKNFYKKEKFDPTWIGPYVVDETFKDGKVVQLIDKDGNKVDQTHNENNLKRYNGHKCELNCKMCSKTQEKINQVIVSKESAELDIPDFDNQTDIQQILSHQKYNNITYYHIEFADTDKTTMWIPEQYLTNAQIIVNQYNQKIKTNKIEFNEEKQKQQIEQIKLQNENQSHKTEQQINEQSIQTKEN